MYPTLTETDLFAKCVEGGNYTYDPTPSPGIARGDPYMRKNTIGWKITGAYPGVAWDAGSSGDINFKVRLEAKKTGESSYTTAATYDYDSIFRSRNIVIDTDTVFPQSQYTTLTSLRISIGLPAKYQGSTVWIWSIFNVGTYMTFKRNIHIKMDAGWNEIVDGTPEKYYIPNIRIYESDNTSTHTYDEFHSAIACRNDLLRFSTVSDQFSSITDGTKVVTSVIKVNEYGIPSMMIYVGEKSGTYQLPTRYYLKLNTKVPTTLKIGQAVRYTDLKDGIVSELVTYPPYDPTATHYTITWNISANGGQYRSRATTSVEAGKAIGRSGDMPYACKAGYYFAGWYTAPTGGTQISSSTVPTGDTTYYAQFRTTTTATANGSNRVTCDSSGNVFLKNDTY